MINEESAGGVVIRKHGHSWQVLILRDMNGNWTFPKGIIEKDENHEDAAEREIAEEVGIVGLKLLKKLTPIHYMYTRGQLRSKTVHYFLFRYEGKQSPKPERREGISEVAWVSLSRARGIIGYAKTNTKVLEEVKWILNPHRTYKH